MKKHFWTLKRTMDIAVSFILLLALSPLFAIVALLIKLGSCGPVFYRSQRIGKNCKPFKMLKFRSMICDAEHFQHRLTSSNHRDEILFKVYGDPRITHTGYWLRRYSIDELPQLWNVLRGEMSLVGPRPALPSEVAKYGPSGLWRLRVPQGMTGLWQVRSRNHPSFRRYLRWDLYYIRHCTLNLDLHILYHTAFVVLRGTGI